MMNRRSILGILPVGVALAALPISASRAATPAVDTIKSFYDTLLSVMQQAKALGLKGRYEKLDPAIHRAFNLPLMTRLSVGPDWQKLSPEEQKSLTAAFSDLSVSTYAARFDGYCAAIAIADIGTSRSTCKCSVRVRISLGVSFGVSPAGTQCLVSR